MMPAALTLLGVAVLASVLLERQRRRRRSDRVMARARAEAARRTCERQAVAATEAAFLEAHQAAAVRTVLVEASGRRVEAASTLARPLTPRQLLAADAAHVAAVGTLVYDPAVWER